MSIQSIYHSTSNAISNYASHIPKNTVKAAVVAGAFSYAVSFLILNNAKASSVYGAIAITATLIHGAVSPLFQKFANDQHQLSLLGETLRTGISCVGSFALAASLGYRFPLKSISLVVAANLFPYLLGTPCTSKLTHRVIA
ncbi:hypothetical protein [Candidatus Protochlamydia amoebophila]|uniref:Uncharacterized protein n=1 Tax=Protochlamydia amoebophila (strain UWE25) TaxID=264201 RepID=Q6MBY9_PARUW|nr:hypothetical protein [Candidatus Protochlamydia amoebophila]CAF23910.1 unnamed protein product [Candidatus Protochlamydia amoebophila UWE25]